MSSRGMFRTATVLALGVGLTASSCTRWGFSFDRVSSEIGDGGKIAGTDVGNPKRPTKAAIKILNAACKTLARCLNINVDACNIQAQTARDIEPPLGLPLDSYGLFSSLINAEANLSILGSEGAASSCAAELQALSCQDPLVIGAYSPPNTYQNFAAMIPTGGACPTVFGNALRVTPPTAAVAPFLTVLISGRGGTPPYTYALETGGAGGSLSPIGGGVIYNTPAAAGTQAVTVRDAAGAEVRSVVTITARTALSIYSGATSSCAYLAGSLQCWGRNDLGQLGNGTITPKVLSPGIQSPPLGNLLSIAMASDTAAAVDPLGGLFTWGSAILGQLGDGVAINRISPNPIAFGVAGSVWAGSMSRTFCAMDTAGSLFCWGDNSSGQVGNGVVGGFQDLPALVAVAPGGITSVSTGPSHSCAVKGGVLYCWGQRNLLGDGNVGGVNPNPQLIPAFFAGGVTEVSVGMDSTCAIQSGALFCWGLNTSGDVGNGNIVPEYFPVQIFASGATSVSVGAFGACAVVNGGVRCWGANTAGQVGLFSGGQDVMLPMEVNPIHFAGPVTQVRMGQAHACALSKGVVKCWGANAEGQLGNGSPSQSFLPVVVGPWL